MRSAAATLAIRHPKLYVVASYLIMGGSLTAVFAVICDLLIGGYAALGCVVGGSIGVAIDLAFIGPRTYRKLLSPLHRDITARAGLKHELVRTIAAQLDTKVCYVRSGHYVSFDPQFTSTPYYYEIETGAVDDEDLNVFGKIFVTFNRYIVPASSRDVLVSRTTTVEELDRDWESVARLGMNGDAHAARDTSDELSGRLDDFADPTELRALIDTIKRLPDDYTGIEITD